MELDNEGNSFLTDFCTIGTIPQLNLVIGEMLIRFIKIEL